jgi:histone H4
MESSKPERVCRHAKTKTLALARRQGLSKGDIRRLARRGGVKRIGGMVYEEVGEVLRGFLRRVLHDTIEYAQYARRATVLPKDVVCALKRQGITLYGLGC